jgi:hypothetical protein
MTQEQKAAWVAALRSGEYQQGAGRLRSANGEFCALGVLCHVIDPDSWEIREGLRGRFMVWRGFGGRVSSDILPTDAQCDVTRLNDTEGESFPEIANWIEENVVGEE